MRDRRARGRPRGSRVVPVATHRRQGRPRAMVVPLAQGQRDLEPDLRRRDRRPGAATASATLQDRSAAAARPAAITLSPDLRLGIGQAGQRSRFIKPAEIGERPERLDPRLGPFVLRHQGAERRECLGAAPVQEQPLDRVALPAAGAVERGDQARGVEPVEARDRPRLLVDREDAVDPPLVAAGAEVEPLSQSSGIHSGCSMTARYMSAIQSAPSGPVLSIVGRNQLSLEARNSRPARWVRDGRGRSRRRARAPSGAPGYAPAR